MHFQLCRKTILGSGGCMKGVAKVWSVTPTSGAIKLGKIPLSARGSSILDLRRTAANSQLASQLHYLTYYSTATQLA